MDKLNIEELRKYYPNLDIEKIPLSALKRLAYKKAYNKTDKCKAYKKAYNKTDKCKAYKKAYQKSDKYKTYQKTYQKSDKCKAYKKAYYQKKKLLKGVIKEDNWEGWQKQEERISRKVINNG